MSGDESDVSLITPPWVNEEFVETVLNGASEGTTLKVKAFECKDACKEGMSYSSYILRIVATVERGGSGTREERSFILKYRPADREPEGADAPVEPERVVAGGVMAEVHRLLRGVEGAAWQPVAPACYLGGRFLALEDLAPAGFTTAAGARPLGYQQCAAVLRAYARLHAASARVLRDNPRYRTLLDPKRYMTEGLQQYYRQFSDHLFKAVARTLRAHEGYEIYAAKYERLAEKFTNAFFNYWRSAEVRLPVVLHGDCWKYNFMFKYENENVTGVRLIDFQESLVHSGAADLQHFLHRNAGVGVLRGHAEALLAEYHGLLVALLRRLGMAEEAERYPLEALRGEVRAAAASALYYSALSLMSLTSHHRSAHWGEFFQMTDRSHSLLEDAFSNPHYVSCLKYLVPLFDKQGLL